MQVADIEQHQVWIWAAAGGHVHRVIGVGMCRLAEVAVCEAEACLGTGEDEGVTERVREAPLIQADESVQQHEFMEFGAFTQGERL